MSSCNNSNKNDSKVIEGKIIHSVYFWLNNPDNKNDIETFETAIKKLMKNSQYANKMHLGKPAVTEKREVIDNIGLFDEKFFMYWEEVDLSFRIKELNLKLISTTKTHIRRQENSPERNINAVYYYIRNLFYMQNKYKHVSNFEFNLYVIKSFIFQVIYGVKNGELKVRIKKFFEGIKDGSSK